MIDNIFDHIPYTTYGNGRQTKKAADVSPKSTSFQDSLQSVSAAWDTVETRTTAGKLSAQEIAGLASKYDPHHMTQEQYDAFLDELETMGALSQEDKWLVKNPDMRFVGGKDLDVYGIVPGEAAIEDNPLHMRLLSLEEADGDAARLVKAMLTYECGLANRGPAAKEDHQRIAALRTVSDILGRMET